jgi:hypothetical protein
MELAFHSKSLFVMPSGIQENGGKKHEKTTNWHHPAGTAAGGDGDDTVRKR